MSECTERDIQSCHTGQHLRACTARAYDVYRHRMLRVHQVTVCIMYSFHRNMSFSFSFLKVAVRQGQKACPLPLSLPVPDWISWGSHLHPDGRTPSARTSFPNTPAGSCRSGLSASQFCGAQTDARSRHIEERSRKRSELSVSSTSV